MRRMISLVAAGTLAACDDSKTPDPSDTATSWECPDNGWIDIAAGALLSCGIHDGGCAECWGNTAFAYEIAESDGHIAGMDTGWRYTDYDDDKPPPVAMTEIALPRDVPKSGLGEIREMYPTQGSFFGCGIDTTGFPLCWGDDEHENASPPPAELRNLTLGKTSGCGMDPLYGWVLCWGFSAGFHGRPFSSIQSIDMANSEWICGVGEYDGVLCELRGQSTPVGSPDRNTVFAAAVDTGEEKGFCALDIADTLTCTWDGCGHQIERHSWFT